MAITFQLGDGPAGDQFEDDKKNYIVESHCITTKNRPKNEVPPAPRYQQSMNGVGKFAATFPGGKLHLGEESGAGHVLTKNERIGQSSGAQKDPSYLSCATSDQSNINAGNLAPIFTKGGVDFSVTINRHYHGGDLTAAVANPRIVSELGAGWEIADWTDFSSFTENDFLGVLRLLAPHAVESLSCQELQNKTSAGKQHEWNLGWILVSGNGNSGSSTSYFWTFANNNKAPWYAKQGSYLSDFVIYGAWFTTLPYLAKRAGSSLQNSQTGCF